MPEPGSRSQSGRPGGWGRAALYPLVAVAIGLSGGFVFGRGLKGPSAPSAAVPVEAPTVVAAPAPRVEPPTATPAPAPPPPVSPPVPDAGAAHGMARLHLRSTPSGAQVARASDGEPLGVTPLDLDLPESQEPLSLLLWKKGYPPAQKDVVVSGEVTVTVPLAPRRHRSSSEINSTTTIDPFN